IESHVVLPQEVDALLASDRVRALIKDEVEKYQSGFKGFERIREFALIADDFTTGNGMLTPSLKLKRRAVLAAHGRILEDLYATGNTARRVDPKRSSHNTSGV
ncbi:MAG: hypothetical protein M3O50_04655, partial [Myxococcota bacterium]|nr:hypothetical protein [Myxococcota bacterium]